MIDPVKTLAERILTRLASYRPSAGSSSCADFDPHVGRVFGVYENGCNDFIFVTDRGLLLQNFTGRTFIAFADIAQASVPSEDKFAVDEIIVTLANGTSVSVPIRNGKGRFRDIWEFSRFLNRAYPAAQAAVTNCRDAADEYGVRKKAL